jgi:hypothetical protein
MKAKVDEVLELMKYRKFWHRDHELKCDVVCVSFKRSTNHLRSWQTDEIEALMRAEAEDIDKFTNWLISKGINAYVHCGPTGSSFVAVVCSDSNKILLEKIN